MHVVVVNTKRVQCRVRTAPPVRPARKPSNRYHHGDLPRALVQEAVRTIQARGIDALTLRAVGGRLGVSRTALYRHFADKEALLAAVATEGFRTLRTALIAARDARGRGRDGLERMGAAYVQFALTHPSHYRVMFGGRVRSEVIRTIGGADTYAFQVLVDAMVAEQQAGRVRRDDPLQLAVYAWAVVHGVAMLALDGLLPPTLEVDALVRLANERLRAGIAI
jgi:AcrR family transcriptional regulator